VFGILTLVFDKKKNPYLPEVVAEGRKVEKSRHVMLAETQFEF